MSQSAERAFKFLGTVEEVTTCDCCGKSNLKHTVAFELVETGDIVHYGSTCAVRHTGRKLNAHMATKKAEEEAKEKTAHTKVWQSPEHHALVAKFALRENAKILPGRPARDFLEPEYSKFYAVAKSICDNAGVKVCHVNQFFRKGR